MRKLLLLLLFPVCAHALLELEGAGLYWRPINADFDYAVRDDKRVILRPHHHGGFEVGGSVNSWCGDYVGVRYLHIAFDDVARNQGLVPLLDDEITAYIRAKESLNYRTFDVFIGHRFLCPRNATLYAFGGVGYVKVKERRTVNSDRSNFLEEYKFEAGGPEIGLGIHSCKWCWISGVIEMRLMAAIGKRNTIQTNLLLPAQTLCLPLFSFKMGIAGTIPLGPAEVSLEVGYRLDYLFQVRKTTRLIVSGNNRTMQMVHSDLGFGGPYFGVRAGF